MVQFYKKSLTSLSECQPCFKVMYNEYFNISIISTLILKHWTNMMNFNYLQHIFLYYNITNVLYLT